MKTILVDDELSSMEQFLEECQDIEDIELVGCFENPIDALAYAEKNEVEFALLDIEMPGMDGLELGKRLKQYHPQIVLIYVTGYSQYAIEAMKLKADYYVLKPYDKRDIEDAIMRALLLSKRQKKRITAKMFGHFDLFVEDKVVHFSNAKSKELLALCLDRNGGDISMDEVVDKLWAERSYDERVKRLYRKAIMNLQSTLKSVGAENLFYSGRGSCHINREEIDCDYYDYLDNPVQNKHLFDGEFLFDYSWGEDTLAHLSQLERRLLSQVEG